MSVMLKVGRVLLLVGLSCAMVAEEREHVADEADSRFFFGSVKSDPCTTTSTTYTSGTCYRSRECSRLGGTGAGTCSRGFGTCCYFIRSCGSYTIGRSSFFKNPSLTTSLDCSLEVRLLSSNICQLRLDFKDFELAPTNASGQCETDVMTVTGTANGATVPPLCGSNTGQHIYIDVDSTVGNPTINVKTGSTAYDRSWNVNVEQIACNSEDKAPNGCLQYYTATSAIVESFNYVRPTAAEIASNTASVHLNSQNYLVCIDSSSYSCIQWSQNTAAEPYGFMMSGSADGIPAQYLGTEAVLSTGTECESDRVVIPGGTFNDGAVQSANEYCGLGFPDVVSSTRRPFSLRVITDDSETYTDVSDGSVTGDAGNVGYSLRYRLISTC